MQPHLLIIGLINRIKPKICLWVFFISLKIELYIKVYTIPAFYISLSLRMENRDEIESRFLIKRSPVHVTTSLLIVERYREVLNK